MGRWDVGAPEYEHSRSKMTYLETGRGAILVSLCLGHIKQRMPYREYRKTEWMKSCTGLEKVRRDWREIESRVGRVWFDGGSSNSVQTVWEMCRDFEQEFEYMRIK